MHCISLAILSRLSRFISPAVGTNWPLCVDLPLNTNQSKNEMTYVLVPESEPTDRTPTYVVECSSGDRKLAKKEIKERTKRYGCLISENMLVESSMHHFS